MLRLANIIVSARNHPFRLKLIATESKEKHLFYKDIIKAFTPSVEARGAWRRKLSW
jgi:hypothetical protein